MKRIFIFIVLALALVNISYAQKDITKFMGIPVDGNKYEVVDALLEKGFEYDTSQDNWTRLTGFFNGAKSDIYVNTNKNLVSRISVIDSNTYSESQIINRFNNLVIQFANNKNYISDEYEKYLIPQNEDISYEMICHNKNYEAIFYQKPDTIDIKEHSSYLSDLSDEEISNMVNNLIQTDSLYLGSYKTFDLENFNNHRGVNFDKDRGWLILIAEIYNFRKEYFNKYDKPVWFKICQHRNEYCIAIFYDNENNRANGEDL